MTVIYKQQMDPTESSRYGIAVDTPEDVQILRDFNDTGSVVEGNLYLIHNKTYKWNGSSFDLTLTGNSGGEPIVTANLFITEFDSILHTDVGANQGNTIDPISGDFYTAAADDAVGGTSTGTQNFTIRRFNSSGTIQQTTDLSGSVPAGCTQVNGLEFFNGRLFAGGNNHPTIPEAGWIFELNPTTLAIIATHATTSESCEGGAWRNDPVRGDEFWAIFHSAQVVERFNSDFSSSTIFNFPAGFDTRSGGNFYQDAIWFGDYIFCNLHNSSIWPHACDVYYWNGTAFELHGRMPQPLWEGTTPSEDKASQGLELSPDSNHLLWSVRRGGGGPNTDPHDIARSTFNKTAVTVNSNYTDSIQALSDLLVYYDFRETSGTTINNKITTSPVRNASLLGGNDLGECGNILSPVYDEDARGIALSDPDYVSIPHDAGLSLGSGDFSFGCIFMVYNVNNNHWIVSKGDTGDDAASDHNYAILLNNPSYAGKIGFFLEDTTLVNRHAASSADYETGKFYRVVCNYYASGSPNRMELWVNGVLVGTNNISFTPNTNSQPITFNAIAGPGSESDSIIYDYWLRDSATSSAEVAALESAFLGG